jgi:hypothetical protein
MYISSLISTLLSLKFLALKQIFEAVCKSERMEETYARRQLSEKRAQCVRSLDENPNFPPPLPKFAFDRPLVRDGQAVWSRGTLKKEACSMQVSLDSVHVTARHYNVLG